MKKVLIAHFSQSGTTARVANKIAQGFNDNDYTIHLHRIQDKEPVNIDDYDIIGIGFPVYIYRVPFIVKKFIKDLPALKSKPFFVFLLYGTKRGTAGNVARRLLERKGGREVSYSYYTGDDLYIGYIKKGYLFSPGHPVREELHKAYAVSREIHEVINGKPYLKPAYEPLPGIVFTLERFLTIKPLVNYFYRFFYHADRDRCTQCGICIKNCPTGNIKQNKKGYPKFGNNCISCWYCEMKCPVEAISSPHGWPVLKLFDSYNVRKTLKDPTVEYVRVKHSKGRIERL